MILPELTEAWLINLSIQQIKFCRSLWPFRKPDILRKRYRAKIAGRKVNPNLSSRPLKDDAPNRNGITLFSFSQVFHGHRLPNTYGSQDPRTLCYFFRPWRKLVKRYRSEGKRQRYVRASTMDGRLAVREGEEPRYGCTRSYSNEKATSRGWR